LYRSSSCARRYSFSDRAPLLERALEHVHQLVDLKRLADEVARAALDRLDGVLHRAISRDDDGDDIRIARDGGFDHRRTVDARQPQVGEDDVEGKIRELSDGRFARFGLLHPEAPVRQLLGDRLAEGCLILDDEYMSRRFSHLQGRQDFDTRRTACRDFVPNLLCSSLRYTFSREARAKWNEKRSPS